MKLCEIAGRPQPINKGVLRDEKSVRSWLDMVEVKNYRVYSDDLTVDVTGSVNLRHTAIERIQVQFRTVRGDFIVAQTSLVSMRGSPMTVGGDFVADRNPRLNKLAGLPRHVGASVGISSTGIRSLTGIHKLVDHIGDTLFINTNMKSNILGVVKINGLMEINVSSVSGNFNQRSPLGQALDIINKYLPRGNIHECQEELIEAGLKEFARL